MLIRPARERRKLRQGTAAASGGTFTLTNLGTTLANVTIFLDITLVGST